MKAGLAGIITKRLVYALKTKSRYENPAPATGPSPIATIRLPVWRDLEDQLQAQLNVTVASRSEHRIAGCLVRSFAGRGKWRSTD